MHQACLFAFLNQIKSNKRIESECIKDLFLTKKMSIIRHQSYIGNIDFVRGGMGEGRGAA